MSRRNCLGCYQELEQNTSKNNSESENEYHKKCSKKLFRTETPPRVNFGLEQLEEIAKEAIYKHLGITGVQPKIPVELAKYNQDPRHRMMIVGLWGNFILKPPTPRFPDIAITEDATMHMAKAAGIKTVLHGLIRLKSGELAYITRRFDREKHRNKTKKIAVEDFCQLSKLLTERKYKTSMEKAGKIILEYSSNPGLDVITFFDITLFSFLTGNADMHLKNFSLMALETGEMGLSPAYDLLSTRLMPIQDPEEMALTVNEKKARLKREDFEKLGETLKIPQKAIKNSFERLAQAIPKMKSIIDSSFLSDDFKYRYVKLVHQRASTLKFT